MSSLPITSVLNDGYIASVYEAFAAIRPPWTSPGGNFFVSPKLRAGSRQARYDAWLLRKAAGAASSFGAIQRYGHLAVQLDPLGRRRRAPPSSSPSFTASPKRTSPQLPALALGPDGTGPPPTSWSGFATQYCGALGYEFEHLNEEAEREWFRGMIESGSATARSPPTRRRHCSQRLTEVDGLERFLGARVRGREALLHRGRRRAGADDRRSDRRAGATGAREVVIGMAHRGRLNVLTHVMGKPYRELLEEFEGEHRRRTPRAIPAT